MGASYLLNFPEARKVRHQRDHFVRLRHLTLQLPLTDIYFLRRYHKAEMNLPQGMHNTISPCSYSSIILDHPTRKYI